MGWRFVKQPNGLLARFSDVVDNFTEVDLTVQAAAELCKSEYSMSDAESTEKVKAGVEDWKPYTRGAMGSGQCRWNDCLKAIRAVHGEAVLKKTLTDMGIVE